MALRKVKLYGELGKRYGKEFMLDVNSPRDAVRLLSANFPDMPKYLVDNSEPGYHVIVGENSVGEKELLNPAFGSQEIKIIPVVMGSDDGGIFQVVLGAALIVASGGVAMGVPIGMFEFGLAAEGLLSNLGWALVLGGVSQMLFAPPQTDLTPNERPENKPSYAFDGPVNTIRQGNPVPIGYGRLLIGSQVISAGLFAESILEYGSGGGEG